MEGQLGGAADDLGSREAGALVAQRVEMVGRLEDEIQSYALELGTDGRLLTLQLSELAVDFARLPELLERDYRAHDDADFSLQHLRRLSTAQLVEPGAVARARLGASGWAR